MLDKRMVAGVVGFVLCLGARADETRVALFNGKDLTGWTVKCKPEDREKAYWTFLDGEICVDSVGDKDHNYVWLQHESEFSDFELRILFKVFRGVPGNTGIQIRSRYDDEVGWLNGPQVDIHPPLVRRAGLLYDETKGVNRWIHPSLERGDHNILPSMTNPRVKLVYGDEGWNELVITAQGTHITTRVNGEVASDYDGSGVLDDKIHREHNVGLKGHIALQLHNRDELRARFKEITIREL